LGLKAQETAWHIRCGEGEHVLPPCATERPARLRRASPCSGNCIVEAGDAVGWERLNLGPQCSWPVCGCLRGRAAEQRRVAGPCVCRLQPCAWAEKQPGARASPPGTLNAALHKQLITIPQVYASAAQALHLYKAGPCGFACRGVHASPAAGATDAVVPDELEHATGLERCASVLTWRHGGHKRVCRDLRAPCHRSCCASKQRRLRREPAPSACECGKIVWITACGTVSDCVVSNPCAALQARAGGQAEGRRHLSRGLVRAQPAAPAQWLSTTRCCCCLESQLAWRSKPVALAQWLSITRRCLCLETRLTWRSKPAALAQWLSRTQCCLCLETQLTWRSSGRRRPRRAGSTRSGAPRTTRWR